MKERAAREIEPSHRLGIHRALRLRLSLLFGQRREIDERQMERVLRRDDLHRLAFHFLEGRAQRLMPSHDLADGGFQSCGVERSIEAECVGHIVGRAAGIDPVDEPEPPLREGGRENEHVLVPGG